MLTVHCWDEISSEWQLVEINVDKGSPPEEIIRTVDAATSEPLGFIPSEETWHLASCSRTGPVMTIVCRTNRNHLGIILINYEENGLNQRFLRAPKNDFLDENPVRAMP